MDSFRQLNIFELPSGKCYTMLVSDLINYSLVLGSGVWIGLFFCLLTFHQTGHSIAQLDPGLSGSFRIIVPDCHCQVRTVFGFPGFTDKFFQAFPVIPRLKETMHTQSHTTPLTVSSYNCFFSNHNAENHFYHSRYRIIVNY
jgi:hypothetical protein